MSPNFSLLVMNDFYKSKDEYIKSHITRKIRNHFLYIFTSRTVESSYQSRTNMIFKGFLNNSATENCKKLKSFTNNQKYMFPLNDISDAYVRKTNIVLYIYFKKSCF